ncbi:MAG: hypothetical protein KME22_08325 [Hassallia sp. WJT32-NPBG1]|jgi:hypothetical protein|nr:hypothetical protein [Hassallia sp. WJT32-NPBG1]
MAKNKLLIALLFCSTLIPLIWSATIKSVNADVEVENADVEVENADVENFGSEDELLQRELQEQSATGIKYRNFAYQRATIDDNSATANCRAKTWKGSGYIKDNKARIICHISDIGDDGDSVYAKWWLDGYPSRSLNNKEGYKTTVKKIDSNNTPDPIGTINFQVCRSAWFNDPCSETRSWRVN